MRCHHRRRARQLPLQLNSILNLNPHPQLAPELADLSDESEATKKLYGLDQPVTPNFGAKCLIARRLLQRGVRFVQAWSSSTTGDND